MLYALSDTFKFRLEAHHNVTTLSDMSQLRITQTHPVCTIMWQALQRDPTSTFWVQVESLSSSSLT